jgi:hypothetical protein
MRALADHVRLIEKRRAECVERPIDKKEAALR